MLSIVRVCLACDGETFACFARNHSTRPVVTSARV